MSTNKRPPSPIDRALLTDQPGVGTLHLVRHGQQVWPDPETSVPSDWVDPPLSELGRRQADCVGRWFADQTISAVYSSQLVRANDTGKAIAAHHGLDVDVIEALEEIRLFEGMQDQSPSEVFGEKAMLGMSERFFLTQSWDAYPLTETSLDFRRRIGWAIESVLASHAGETIVIACHGGVINAYVADLLGLSVDMFFRPCHASSHRILFSADRRVIDTLNEQHYLAAEDLVTH